jgi:hypothetical protein
MTIRWTVARACEEFHKTARLIREGLRANHIEPGPDGKFSSLEIATACFELPALEKQAKEAKLQQVIDDAARAKLKREVEEGQMAPIKALIDWHLDIITQVVQFIRHSSMTDAEKKQLVTMVTEYEYVPAGTRTKSLSPSIETKANSGRIRHRSI